jgi:hypothetical protein
LRVCAARVLLGRARLLAGVLGMNVIVILWKGCIVFQRGVKTFSSHWVTSTEKLMLWVWRWN